MLIYTFIVLVLLFLLAFVIFDSDILAPPTVLTLSFVFGILCTIYNEKRWGLNFSEKTMMVIVSGIFSFILGGLLAALFRSKFHPRDGLFSHEVYKTDTIQIGIYKTIAVIVFQIVVLVILFNYIKKMTGYSNWLSAISEYRKRTTNEAYFNDASVAMPFLLRNMIEVGFVIGSVYAYVLGNNIAAGHKTTILDWIPVILCAITTFMQGDRSNMIRLWLVIIIVAYTLKKRSIGYKKNKDTSKLIRRIGLSLLAVGALFVLVREFVGRETNLDPLSYVTFYAGCPIAALDQFLHKTNIAPSEIWGKETFYYTNVSLHALFGFPEKYSFYKEFTTSPNGTQIGNVYTVLRPPYRDFGYLGMLIVMLIAGGFFTWFYCSVRKKHGTGVVDFPLFLYAYIAYTYFLYFYNCYNAFLSHTFIKFIIEAYIVFFLLLKVRIKTRQNC